MIPLRNTKALFLMLGITLIGLYACKSEVKSTIEAVVVENVDPATLVGEETQLLLDYLVELGDYVNSRSFPSLIKAASVNEALGTGQLIVDIRSQQAYANGHIKGATNINFNDLLSYFESEIVPFEYDKIILVSEAGQVSSYATCILRLMGYGNVYSMRWGMSAWNNDFASTGWKSFVGSDFEDKLVSDNSTKALVQKMPELNTGKTTGEEVLLERAKLLFAEGPDPAHLKASDVFAATESFYVMNYIRKDKYEAGHIPGAIRYKPQSTLGIVTEMSTIDQDKPSVVYCGTGHNSGFVTAYLRLFGYDAKTLIYGNNGFMYNKMLAEKETLSWLPFTDEEVNDFPYIR